MFYNNLLKKAKAQYDCEVSKYNEIACEIKDAASNLYIERKSASMAIYRVELYINTIANTPQKFHKEINEINLSIQEFRDIVANDNTTEDANLLGATIGLTGIAIGTWVLVLGTNFNTPTPAAYTPVPSNAHSIQNSLSTGNSNKTSNKDAWVMGGAAAITAIGLAIGGWLTAKTNKEKADVFNQECKKIMQESEVLRHKKNIIEKMTDSTRSLRNAIDLTTVTNLFPSDYNEFSSAQKQKLAAIINAAKTLGREINKNDVNIY